jgi:hypothetical protein
VASEWALRQRAIVSTRGGWATAPAVYSPPIKSRGVGSRRKARHAMQRTIAQGRSLKVSP